MATELVEGEGQGTMTYTRNRGGRKGRMPALLLDGLTLINETEREERENKRKGVALV